MQAPNKWLGHQAGVPLDQYGGRRAARRFRLLAKGVAGVWIVESEPGREESGRRRGVVAVDDKKVLLVFFFLMKQRS